MTRQHTTIAIAVLTLAVGLTPASAEIVYDNTTNPATGSWFLDPDEDRQLGDEITLEPGTNRVITKLHIGVATATSGTATGVQARIYDLLGGEPGNLLFESTAADFFVDDALDVNVLTFDVPNVLVPDTVVWTITTAGWPSDDAELPSYSPPDIGSSDHLFFWRLTTDDEWKKTPVDEIADNFYAQLEAVPAPGAAGLGLIGLGLVGWIRRRLV